MAEGQAAEQNNMRVIATSKTLKIEPFKIPDNHLKVGRAWEEWIEDFEDEITYFEIREIRDKISALKIYGGQELKKLARYLPDPPPIEVDNEYEKLKRK
jgi:lysyl-tRNA synthetase class I